MGRFMVSESSFFMTMFIVKLSVFILHYIWVRRGGAGGLGILALPEPTLGFLNSHYRICHTDKVKLTTIEVG